MNDWPTYLDYATVRSLFDERYPGLRLEMTDLEHREGYDRVIYHTNEGPRYHRLDLDEDDQVVLRPYKI